MRIKPGDYMKYRADSGEIFTGRITTTYTTQKHFGTEVGNPGIHLIIDREDILEFYTRKTHPEFFL